MNFEDFLIDVDPQYLGFVCENHDDMIEKGCTLKMATAKNGYVVSYYYGKKKRVLINFVFRSGELVARIYGGNIDQYLDVLDSMPDDMKKTVMKAPKCRRFEDPPKCSPKCIGYTFSFNGEHHQKCRYNCFLFKVTDESIPFIKKMTEKELACRTAIENK